MTGHGRFKPAKKATRPYRRPQPDAARRAAFDTLVAVTARGAYANLVLPGMLADRRITGRDAAFATELAYGTLRARGQLDAVLATCSSRPIQQVDPRVLELLRLGAYQLLHMRVPAHAGVAATVEVARVAVTDGPAKFVNAVLRRVAERDLDGWLAEVAPDDPVGQLSIAHSHPEWIVRAFADALSEKPSDLTETAAALAADGAPTATHLVARPGRISRDGLVAATGGQAGRFSPYAVYLDGGDPAAIAAVSDNRAAVQDEGSQLCALALANLELAGADRRWLDLCAGPGGKAGLLGAVAAERGASVVAVEQSEHRADLVARTTAGLPVTVVHADGRSVGEHPDLPEAAFDRVLVDAPCTGLGALRRRPEARWRRQPSDVNPLVRLQRELALAAFRAVRPGGVLAYVVCSPHLAETRVQVADLVRRTSAELVDARPLFPDLPGLGDGPTVQLWPHRQGTDAMFLALLRKPTS
ncbi:RsmB/NOP family class I SAM-dependent RNA methyltransferase [Fodinicola acaciae]|uniref:RsmB/NOP family class I SAM-dependent RNA methyltransferase n=1 Tax=Fodinicola acaciae TaxID=2681555 RepID=UPI0013D0BB0B|nr:transcription antitermination factor NusB [Fodinicola acaciae]